MFSDEVLERYYADVKERFPVPENYESPLVGKVVPQTPSDTDHVEVYRGQTIRIARDVIQEVFDRFGLDAALEARRKIDYELDGDSH